MHVEIIEPVQRRFLLLVHFRVDGVYPSIGFPYDILLIKDEVDRLSSRRVGHIVNFLIKYFATLSSPICQSFCKISSFRYLGRLPSSKYVLPTYSGNECSEEHPNRM